MDNFNPSINGIVDYRFFGFKFIFEAGTIDKQNFT